MKLIDCHKNPCGSLTSFKNGNQSFLFNLNSGYAAMCVTPNHLSTWSRKPVVIRDNILIAKPAVHKLMTAFSMLHRTVQLSNRFFECKNLFLSGLSSVWINDIIFPVENSHAKFRLK